jgi:hypothetical protein
VADTSGDSRSEPTSHWTIRHRTVCRMSPP